MLIQRSVVAVPARLASSRLPNKVLAEIGGKPMIQGFWNDVPRLMAWLRWCFAPIVRFCSNWRRAGVFLC